ncbi:MAG TPA: HPF/RaiA family ribosome-associated protein [Gemmatimonadales bacterium]|nr:HPF/RaiA family ribosome-associated protein [Gemmatimonadales bacterium]
MHTIITARHCEIPDELRERARQVVDRVGTFAARPIEATVLFDVDGALCTVEIRIHLARGEWLVAGGEAGDHRTALDRAEEKARKQAERSADRPRRSRASEPQIEI